MLISTHIGISLDGLVATPDGLSAWEWSPNLDSSVAPPPGYSDFMANIGAVIIGRTSFEQGLPDWRNAWPWGDRPVYVLTNRPLPDDLPATVRASRGGAAGVVEELRASGMTQDVQLLGGPAAVKAFMDAGMLDRLGLVVLPMLLHEGIPMFAVEDVGFSRSVWDASPQKPTGRSVRGMKLESQRVFPDGSVQVVYSLP